jgi:uncharacterized membrane protein
MQAMFKDFPKDLSLAIVLAISCMLFVLTPLPNGTPVGVVLGFLSVLSLPRYSLIAVLFQGKNGRNEIEWIVLGFGLSITVVPLLNLVLNCMPFGIWLLPILITLPVFAVSLAIIVYVGNCNPPERSLFAVEVGELV